MSALLEQVQTALAAERACTTDLRQNMNCESGCAYHGITDFVTNTLMKVQHVAVSENSVHNSCVPRTVIWTWRFVLSRQT